MPERSFHYKGRPFPVCARCTGAFVGYLVGLVCFPFWIAPLWLDIAFCAVMFADWFVQRIELLPSTNLRRFITGTLCGFALMQIWLRILLFLANLIT